MILAPTMSTLFGQQQLPASIKPYAVHWGYSLKQMFQAAGYDVPGPKSNYDLVPQVRTRSSELQLDSTVTYYGYGLNSPEDSTPILKNVYTYPQQNVEVVTEYFFDFKRWVPLSRTTLTNDDLGRLVDAFAEEYDEASGTFLPDSKIEFYPHNNSMTEADSFFVYGWAPELEGWYRLLAVWNTFDEEDRLSVSLSSTELFEVPLVFRDKYKYTPDGDLGGIDSYLIDAGEEILGSREIFWYTDHLVTSSILSVSDGSESLVDESRKEYTYTPDGKEELVTSFVMDFEQGEWLMSHVLGYVYDEEDRVSMKEEAALTDNGTWERKLDTYQFIEDRYLALVSTYIFDIVGSEWILEDKTFYYYNETTAYEPVDPIAIDDLIMWPNPSSGYVRFELKGEVSISIYGPTGQLMRQINMTDGDMTIDISHFPAGTYYVNAKSNDAHYSGRLIVQQ